MKITHSPLLSICLAVAFLFASSMFAQGDAELQKPTRIVFLGNSITYDGGYVRDLETYYTIYHQDFKYEFINLGLPSEMVSGLSEPNHADGEFERPNLFSRLDGLLEKVDADIFYVCYGMNDGIYLPFDKKRFEAYTNGIETLYARLQKTNAKKIYMMTPPVHDDAEKGLNGYNKVLDKYSSWLISHGKKKGWNVIDLHFPMKKYLEEKRKMDPDFKLANDGIHPGEMGHWLMAKEILLSLGEDVKSHDHVLSKIYTNPYTKGIWQKINERQHYQKDAWLMYVGHNRPHMNRGIPMEQMKRLNGEIDREIAALLLEKPRIKVACIGNSITEGVGVANSALDSYPAQLQRMLGYEKYEVMNFGVSATTLQSFTDNPYVETDRYKRFLESEPDIVTIKLGTNDSRMPYRETIADSLVVQGKRLINIIRKMPSKPRIILLLPATSYLTDENSQKDEVIINEVVPRIQEIALDEGLEIIDIHAATEDSNNLFPDNLHPNEKGMEIIAKSIYRTIIRENDTSFDIANKIKEDYETSSFYGYECINFDFEGRKAMIAKPKRVAEKKPWIWRARFWGHEPQTDIAMLDRGYHIVYIDSAPLFGNRESVQLWNEFYDYIQELGLCKKVALEAMSRGGVYAYNWAAENPEKVLCVYADAPVLDLLSWPGGKYEGEGSATDWEDLKHAYGFKTEMAAMKLKNSPLDKIEEIVKGEYPMLHIVGDKDTIVPVDENTAIFEKRVQELGGQIKVIHKTDVGHHPHSLKNPKPIVDFIEESFAKDGAR